jgi:integrase
MNTIGIRSLVANSSLALVASATVNRTVALLRRPNAALRTREHLTAGEVERLIEAASTNRQGQRDALMTLLAFRHGLQAAEVCDLRWEQIDPQQCMSAASRTARPPLIR